MEWGQRTDTPEVVLGWWEAVAAMEEVVKAAAVEVLVVVSRSHSAAIVAPSQHFVDVRLIRKKLDRSARSEVWPTDKEKEAIVAQCLFWQLRSVLWQLRIALWLVNRKARSISHSVSNSPSPSDLATPYLSLK